MATQLRRRTRTVAPVDIHKKLVWEPGLCKCGCGGKTPLAKFTYRSRGQVKGMPTLYIVGHQNKSRTQWKVRVDKITGCHIWLGSKRSGTEYGEVRRDGKLLYAHRVAYERKHGPIPSGMKVLHRCDNPPCVYDGHLFLGTQRDNVEDMLSKGRGKFESNLALGRIKGVKRGKTFASSYSTNTSID